MEHKEIEFITFEQLKAVTKKSAEQRKAKIEIKELIDWL